MIENTDVINIYLTNFINTILDIFMINYNISTAVKYHII